MDLLNKLNNKLVIKYFIITIFFYYNYNINENSEHPFYSTSIKPILSNDITKKSVLEKGRKYIDKCLKGIRSRKTYKKQNVKISVIIPLFNCQKTIRESIISIQNQNFNDFELILINDFSQDNTSSIIEKFQKDDNRIKIINNNRNMGTLYSRCIGVLSASGKYIFSLDNDDMYFDEDIFDFIYNKGEKENLDMIGFQTINVWNYTSNIYEMEDIYSYQYPDEYYLSQPELGRWMVIFKGKYLVHNNMLWDKCIKSFVYKKAVNLLGIKTYSTFIIWAEDTSINFVIFNIAQNFKYIHKYGIFHFKSKQTASSIQPMRHKLFAEIFFLNIIYRFSKNNEDKNLAVEQGIFIKTHINLTNFKKSANLIYYKNTLNKIIKNEYITKFHKRKLIKYLKSYFI